MTDTDNLPARVAAAIRNRPELTLELGCGARKQHPDAVGIDALTYPGVDIVADLHAALACIPTAAVAAVHTYHCLEHIADLTALMAQLARVVRPGGRLHVVVPHFSNPYFYSDPTHQRTFGLYTFSYLARDDLLSRKVPTYQEGLYFDLRRVRLIFKSPRPFYGRWVFKRIFQWVFNLHPYLLEWYEENFCYLVPCYEVEYDLVRNERPLA